MTGRPRTMPPHLSERQVTSEIEEFGVLIDMLEQAADALETVHYPCAGCPFKPEPEERE